MSSLKSVRLTRPSLNLLCSRLSLSSLSRRTYPASLTETMSSLTSASTASAAAAPTAADTGAMPPNTLVLGMAFVRKSFAKPSDAKSKTTIAALRDRARLLELEKAGNFIIVSLNKDQIADQCNPQRHLYAHFDRRAVGELIKTFGTKGQLALDAIYADYFRFPGAYLREAYEPFLRSMLPELIARGVMDLHTQLIIPNLAGLLDGIRVQVFKRPEGLPDCSLSLEPIVANDYPLFVATTAAEGASPDAFGGFINAREIEQLDAAHPFVRIRIDEQTSL
jgi:hypothetical protein